MAYTDKELKESTQIAYLSFLEKAEMNLLTEGNKGPHTIKDLILSIIDENDAKINAQKSGIELNNMSLKNLVEFSDIKDSDKAIIEHLSEDMLQWKIIDIHDMNPENGFYSCVIETSEKEAIVAFRGSENMKKYSNLVNDWIKADFGLLNSECTEQQKETEEYADKLIQNGLLDKYDSLAVAGHSLGGNLASHFTISSAENGREDLYRKISQSINFDGPGVSSLYLKKYSSQIEKTRSKLSHYKWSVVGNLLHDIPGEKIENLAINEDLHKKSLLDRIKYKTFTRHDTRSILFDKDNNAKRGKKDAFANLLGKFSRSVDKLIPEFLTSELYVVGSWLFNHITYEKTDGTLGFKMPFSPKAPNRTVAKSDFQIKCGDLAMQTLGLFKKGAKVLESTVKNELVRNKGKEHKEGFGDAFSLAENSNSINVTNINRAINVFNIEIGRDRISNQDNLRAV